MASRVDPGADPEAIARELAFVLAQAGTTLRPQSVRLLRYLADIGPNAETDQASIATDVLRYGTRFRADIDSQVRVAVSRLRKDLAAFYDRFAAFRPLRLSIPKGHYRLVVLPNDAMLLDTGPAPELNPFLVWTISTERTPEAMALGHRIDRALTARIVAAPLVHDGTMRADRIPPSTLNAAVDEAQRAGAPCLARIVVSGPRRPVVLEIHCSQRCEAPIFKQVGHVGPEGDVDALVKQVVLGLTDPLLSTVPGRLAGRFPKSRLALAMSFLRFMATQDRARLTSCFDVFQSAAGSRHDSPLIRALRIDSIRTNYAFATGRVEQLRPDLVDSAARICEDDPYQPYALLAHAYTTIATGGDLPPDLPGGAALGISWEGTLGDDYRLYHALKNAPKSGSNQVGSGNAGSFMADLAEILSAIRVGDIEQAADLALKPRMSDNFWTRVFQCSLAEDCGQRQTARQTFERLRAEVPQAEDFAGRAIKTMIPDKDLHSRLLHNLAIIV